MTRSEFMNIDPEVMDAAMELTGCRTRQELWNVTKLRFGGNANRVQTNKITKAKRRNGEVISLVENGQTTDIGAMHQLLA